MKNSQTILPAGPAGTAHDGVSQAGDMSRVIVDDGTGHSSRSADITGTRISNCYGGDLTAAESGRSCGSASAEHRRNSYIRSRSITGTLGCHGNGGYAACIIDRGKGLGSAAAARREQD